MAWEHVVLSTQWGSCLARAQQHGKACSLSLGGERVPALCKLVAAACSFEEDDVKKSNVEEDKEGGKRSEAESLKPSAALELRFQSGALVLAHVGAVAGAQLVCSFVAGGSSLADAEVRQCAAFAAQAAFAALREQFAEDDALQHFLEEQRDSAQKDAASYGFADAVAVGPGGLGPAATPDLLFGFQDRVLSRLLRWAGPAQDVLTVACACIVLDASLSSVMLSKGPKDPQKKDFKGPAAGPPAEAPGRACQGPAPPQAMFVASCSTGDIRMLRGTFRVEWTALREAVLASSAPVTPVSLGSARLVAVQPASKRWCLLLEQGGGGANLDVQAIDKVIS